MTYYRKCEHQPADGSVDVAWNDITLTLCQECQDVLAYFSKRERDLALERETERVLAAERRRFHTV